MLIAKDELPSSWSSFVAHRQKGSGKLHVIEQLMFVFPDLHADLHDK